MALLPSPPKKYKGTLAACVVALILFVVAAVFGDHGLIHLLRMRGEQQGLEHLAFDLQQRNEQLRQQIRRLQSDDGYIEKLARERLGLVRKDEVIYRVTAPAATAATAPAATSAHK
jgi:cell division protein FtsB